MIDARDAYGPARSQHPHPEATPDRVLATWDARGRWASRPVRRLGPRPPGIRPAHRAVRRRGPPTPARSTPTGPPDRSTTTTGPGSAGDSLDGHGMTVTSWWVRPITGSRPTSAFWDGRKMVLRLRRRRVPAAVGGTGRSPATR
ncbi:hypothetical protein LT493_44355 [Streptomyces tricolor]|nr:hypothetical protein [Streptomyces tricolor]